MFMVFVISIGDGEADREHIAEAYFPYNLNKIMEH
jgi:hypothetical protein